MIKEVNMWTVIPSVCVSIATVHILINKLIKDIYKEQKRFLEQAEQITIKILEEKTKKLKAYF